MTCKAGLKEVNKIQRKGLILHKITTLEKRKKMVFFNILMKEVISQPDVNSRYDNCLNGNGYRIENKFFE